MKLFLVRHGETLDNAGGILQGHTPGILSPRGKLQAAAVAKRLKGERIDYAYSSDLARAVDTMQSIRDAHGGFTFTVDQQIRERSLGVYEGQRGERYMEDFTRSGCSRTAFKPEGGESIVEVQRRTDLFLNQLKARHAPDSVLVCTHGGVVVTLLATILDTPLDEILQHRVPNTALSIVEFDSGQVRLVAFNSVDHLAGIPSGDIPL